MELLPRALLPRPLPIEFTRSVDPLNRLPNCPGLDDCMVEDVNPPSPLNEELDEPKPPRVLLPKPGSWELVEFELKGEESPNTDEKGSD